jgi:arabinose-5-phosphate isomerase
VVLERKGFKEEDFALRHPGGILGRRLLLRVAELMHRGEELPLVSEETLMKEALFEITSKRLGIVGVVNAAGQLVGVVTDGDLRRGLQKHGEKILNKRADELMTRNPRTIGDDALASDALVKMEDPQRPITALFVLENHSRKPIGVIHIHDILKAGL